MDDTQTMLRQAVEATAEGIRRDAARIAEGTEDDVEHEDGRVGDGPYAVQDERGRPFGLLLAGGGPTIWLLADGPFRPYLEGTWFGCTPVRIEDGSDKAFETYMDYFIERDGDE